MSAIAPPRKRRVTLPVINVPAGQSVVQFYSKSKANAEPQTMGGHRTGDNIFQTFNLFQTIFHMMGNIFHPLNMLLHTSNINIHTLSLKTQHRLILNQVGLW